MVVWRPRFGQKVPPASSLTFAWYPKARESADIDVYILVTGSNDEESPGSAYLIVFIFRNSNLKFCKRSMPEQPMLAES